MSQCCVARPILQAATTRHSKGPLARLTASLGLGFGHLSFSLTATDNPIEAPQVEEGDEPQQRHQAALGYYLYVWSCVYAFVAREREGNFGRYIKQHCATAFVPVHACARVCA